MWRNNSTIGIAYCANPDYCSPVVNVIQLLAREHTLVVVCRNQDDPQVGYPDNVRLFRLGRLKTVRQKEAQHPTIKIFEYATFIIRAVFYFRFFRCRCLYCFDGHGLLSGFIASRCGRRLPIIYHNLE